MNVSPGGRLCSPVFHAVRAGPWCFGSFCYFWQPRQGPVAAVVGGSQLRQAYSVQDPAVRIRDGFLAALQSDLGLQDVRIVERPLSRGDVGGPTAERPVFELKATFGNATLFEFQTVEWGLGFSFEHRGEYVIYYSILASLVRLEDSKVLWRAQVRCGSRPKERNPTLDEWLARLRLRPTRCTALRSGVGVDRQRAPVVGQRDAVQSPPFMSPSSG